MATLKKLTATTTRSEAEAGLGLGECFDSLVKRHWCASLRRLKSGRGWGVMVGWAVREAFGDDFGSQGAMGQLAGVNHVYLDYFFGDDFEAARDYWLECGARYDAGQPMRKLALPPANNLPATV